jgi:hemoglobin
MILAQAATRSREPRRSLGLLCILAAAILPAACASDARPRDSATANPEADRRAEMRVGAGRGGGDSSAPRQTLYDRLGGSETIIALVDDFTQRIIADPRVNFERRNVSTNWVGGEYKPWNPSPENIDRFKQHMVEFISLAAGGPAEYTGRDMRALHDGMRITNAEFDAMIGDIKASLDRLNIARAESRDLLAIMETTRKQIVEER